MFQYAFLQSKTLLFCDFVRMSLRLNVFFAHVERLVDLDQTHFSSVSEAKGGENIRQ